MPEEFVLRKAIPSDMERVFHLSNDPSVRENSILEGTITWDEHVAWFSAMLEDPDHVFLVAETPQGELIGQVRFSRRNRERLVSISIHRAFRNRHLGSRILAAAICEIPERCCLAYVKETNVASRKMFEKIGFSLLRHETINNQSYKVYHYGKP